VTWEGSRTGAAARHGGPRALARHDDRVEDAPQREPDRGDAQDDLDGLLAPHVRPRKERRTCPRDGEFRSRCGFALEALGRPRQGRMPAVSSQYTFGSIVERADEPLYRAKNAGRNRRCG
jgi:hypothetical protein